MNPRFSLGGDSKTICEDSTNNIVIHIQGNQLVMCYMIFKISSVSGQQISKVQNLNLRCKALNRLCSLQCGFKIGAVGYSADSKLTLWATGTFNIGAVGYSIDSKSPLSATMDIVLLFLCRLQQGFRIAAVAYSGDSESLLEASVGILKPRCSLQREILEKFKNSRRQKKSLNPLSLTI
jgi:hypothetical protein